MTIDNTQRAEIAIDTLADAGYIADGSATNPDIFEAMVALVSAALSKSEKENRNGQ